MRLECMEHRKSDHWDADAPRGQLNDEQERVVRRTENVLARLKEQMEFLRTSLRAFYAGDFAEGVRIATVIRVLVHESGMSKPLLKQAKPNGLELRILEHVGESTGQAEIFSFAVSVRMGSTVAPAVDLGSSHHTLTSVGAWWNRAVFTFQSRMGTQLIYRRRQVVLILANKEGGAHVDPNEDPDYERLLTDLRYRLLTTEFPLRPLIWRDF